MTITTEREYWVDVTVDDITYEVGANLASYGEHESYPDAYEIVEDPEFYDYIVFDPESGEPMDNTCSFFTNAVEAAQEHLCNTYWNEVLND